MEKVQKKIVESSFFSLITTYSSFFIGIISTFAIARLISTEEWAFLILSNIFIGQAIFVSSCFPPSAQSTLQYYIPHLSKGEEINKIRSFIFHVYKIRILAAIITFFGYILLMYFANFDAVLTQIILIQSPILICSIISALNISIFYAFQKFKFGFISSFINILINTTSIVIIFLFQLENPLILIAYSYLISTFVSCVISTILVFQFIPKRDDDAPKEKYNYFQVHKKYGMNLTIAGFFDMGVVLLVSLFYLESGSILFITYIGVCEGIMGLALSFSSSNRSAYTSIFSKIKYEEDQTQFLNLYHQLNKYSMLFLSIFVAIMFFFAQVIIMIIYTSTYLIILLPIQFYLLTAFSKLLIRNLMTVSQSTNNTKIVPMITFSQAVFGFITIVIAVLYFNFFVLILFYILNSYFILILLIYLVRRFTKFKIQLTEILKLYVIFIICILITIPFLFFNIISFQDELLTLIINSSIRFLIFLSSFYILIYTTKFITKEEFRQLSNILPILSSENKIVQRFERFIDRILPSKKIEVEE